MTDARLRIVSDLHLGEHGSRLRQVGGLEPLLDGASRLVLNGDTLETRFLDLDPHLVDRKHEFEAFAARHGRRVVVITGNHDPDLGERHHLDLEGGAVLVTHGDTLFPEMAPWGWEARYFRQAQERLLALEPPGRRHSWETRLAACKRAVMAVRDLSPRYPGHSSHPWARRLRFLWSLRRVDRILRCWRATPSAGAALAEVYRPEAKVVVIGHTHRPGVWQVRGRTVINTGSLVPPLGALAVDFHADHLVVRRVRVRHGEVRPMEPVASLRLARARAAEPAAVG